MLSGSLIEGYVLFGEARRFFLADAAEKSVHPFVPAAGSIVEVGEDSEVATVPLNGLQRWADLIIQACVLGKEITRVVTQMITDAHQTPWRLLLVCRADCETLKGG